MGGLLRLSWRMRVWVYFAGVPRYHCRGTTGQ
jgi:hypothetical protein